MKATKRFQRSTRLLKIAADLEYWLRIYALDAEMIKNGFFPGLPYYQTLGHLDVYLGIDRSPALECPHVVTP